jgi:DNA-binding NarL/FixJ family response regulator
MGQSDKIKVRMYSRHALTLAALPTVLETYNDLELARQAANGRKTVDLCMELNPRVAVLSMAMEIVDGLTASQLIREHCPDTQVIRLADLGNVALKQSAKKQARISV